MTKFQEVSHTYSCRLVETFTSTTIVKISFTITRYTSFITPFVEVIDICTIEDRSSKLNTKFFTCPTKHSFENLTKVHTRRHTKRVQTNVNWSTISEERHIFLTNNFRNNTFVTVTTRHLVTYADFTFFSNVNFCKLKNSRRKFITNSKIEFSTFKLSVEFFYFT